MIIIRKKYLDKIYRSVKQAPIVILIGTRQVGKTTLLKSLEFNEKSVFFNGQDAEVAELFQKNSVIENYLMLNLNEEKKGYMYIDEFQYINNISTALKVLTDNNPDLKIICTGSSSLDILQKVEESLAGRVRIIEVFSLSFEEYLQFNDTGLYELYLKYDSQTQDIMVDKKIHFFFNDYLIYGGLPRVALEKNNTAKTELLDDIYKTYLVRDVRQFVKNEDFIGFNKLLKILSSQIGNMININELSKTCSLNYKKTEEYLSLLEQMYIIKLINPYNTNKRKVITKMKKLYFSDLGLRNMLYQDFKQIETRTDNGALFENFVYLEVKKNLNKAFAIYYYRTIDGSEIDFIIDNLREKFSLEVKYKKFEKPVFYKNLDNFNKLEQITKTYLINKNFNHISENIQYIQGYLSGKLSFDYQQIK